MARSSSSRSSSSRSPSRSSSSVPARQSPPPPAPAQHHAPPPPAQHHAPAPPAMHAAPPQGGGMLAGLGATMAQGLAFGTGTAVARHAVDGIFNSFSGDKQQAPAAAAPAPAPMEIPAAGPCDTDRLAFMKCLKENPTNAGNCDFYFNTLQACQSRI